MAFDGVTLFAITNELKSLENSKIDKIFVPDQNNILIGLYKNSMNYLLNIDISSNNYRANLTTNTKVNPVVAPNFCMVLRKHIMGYFINKIYTNDFERILYIELKGINNIDDEITKTLIIELMGKYSNCILVDEKFMILEAFKRHSLDDNSSDLSREILPGKYYFLPKNTKQDFSKLSKSEFVEFCLGIDDNDLTSCLCSNFNGISTQFIAHVLSVLKLSNTKSKDSLELIYDYIANIIAGHFECVPDGDNYVIESSVSFADIPFAKGDKNQPFQVNFFIDDFYYKKSLIEDYKNYKNSIMRVIENTLSKITKKIDNIDRKAKECEKAYEYRLYGEILKANIYNFKDQILTTGTLTLLNYYDNTNIDIPVNPSLSVNENAEKYFKKYSKLKDTMSKISVQKKEALKELNYIESLIYAVNSAKTIDDLDAIYDEISETLLFIDTSKLMKFQKNGKTIKEYNKSLNKIGGKKTTKYDEAAQNFYRFKIDDYDVYVGKNNLQNDYLVKRVANPNDIWFHVKDIHGSHLILRTNGDTPKITTIEKCASLSAYYSKAKYSSHVPVDYTLAKYVSKPNGSKPGYVIFTHNKTIYVNPESEF